jgi:hypothetical protein
VGGDDDGEDEEGGEKDEVLEARLVDRRGMIDAKCFSWML